jgi:TorA maturation chaperone TorD
MVSLDIFEKYERAELYRLFSGLFLHEPSDEFIFHMKEIFLLTFDDHVEDIRRDFNNLFIYNRELLPLESIQRKEIFSDYLVQDIERFYHRAGIMLDEEINLPPDHLSTELIFLSYLIETELNETFKRFFEEHIISWVPEYCQKIKEHGQTEFYKESISVFEEFLESEYEELNG